MEEGCREDLCPAPQPEDHIRDLDPGFEEDPDIFIEPKEGVFYQAQKGPSQPIIPAFSPPPT